MKLYLVQHAKAAPAEQDPQRPLTEEGWKKIRKTASFVKPLSLCVDYLWHSGKKRAVQTTEVLASVVAISKTHAMHEGLGPKDDVRALSDELAGLDDDIMIVGHLPFLSKLASLLLSGHESLEPVAIRNAGIVALSRSKNGRWQIEWMITPELIK
jgi:phosphohistidine phosphatase